MSTTTALTKVTSTALSKLNPRITKWFLKKYFPIDTRKLIIEFHHFPNISLNFDSQEHTVWFEFELNNFGIYDLELLKLHSVINTDGYNIVSIKDSIVYELKSDSFYRYQTNHQLTPGEAARVKQCVSNKTLALVDISFHLTVRSRFGLKEINLADKKACVHIRQYPPPQIT